MKKVTGNKVEKNETFDLEKNSISIRADFFLMQEINNYIDSLILKGKFDYSNQSDFIRKAIRAYKDGMELDYAPQTGKKKAMSLIVEEDLFLFYQELPKGNKASIIERCLGTFLKNEN